MSELDRVLDLLDTGLQSTTEPSFACDDPEDCARCQRRPAADAGDLCESCRAFLVGDSDDDPVHGQTAPAGDLDAAAAARAEAVVVTTESFERALSDVIRRIACISEVSAPGGTA